MGSSHVSARRWEYETPSWGKGSRRLTKTPLLPPAMPTTAAERCWRSAHAAVADVRGVDGLHLDDVAGVGRGDHHAALDDDPDVRHTPAGVEEDQVPRPRFARGDAPGGVVE